MEIKRRLIETAIVMVYVIALASVVSEAENTVNEPDEAYMMAEIIKEIDLSVKEYPIDTSVYNEEQDREYREAFYQAISNQIPLNYDDASYNTLYFKNLLRRHLTDDGFVDYLQKEVVYWYMDYDGDGLPELLAEPGGDGIYVFRYNQEEKSVDIISSVDAGWHLLGSGQFYSENDTGLGCCRYTYMWEDAGGNRQSVYLEEYSNLNIYYITYNGSDKIEVSEEMWEELTKEFFAAMKEMPEALTYEDVFGDLLDE